MTPPKKPTRNQTGAGRVRYFSLHLPEGLAVELGKHAEHEERSMSNLCRRALREYIDNHPLPTTKKGNRQ